MEEVCVSIINRLVALWRRRRKAAHNPDDWVIGTPLNEPAVHPQQLVALSEQALGRHVLMLGASGSGKSYLLYSLLRQRILRGHGFGLIDPHGDLSQMVYGFLAEEHQRSLDAGTSFDLDRVVVIDLSLDAIPAFNILDPAGASVHAHISSLVGVFRKMWSSSWGPRMEEALRNCLICLSYSGWTLVEAVPFLVDADFRRRCLQHVPDGALRGYWTDRYDPLTDASQSAIREPILNKVTALTADPRVRCLLGQKQNSLSLRKIMDEGGWLLANCSKGHLRDASSLLGGFLVSAIQTAALSRVELSPESRRPFTLIVDEFQNFASDDFETILSESRKFGLRLCVAHQHMEQVDAAMRNSVFCNVGNHIIFATSAADASLVGRQLGADAALANSLPALQVGQTLVRRRGEPSILTQTMKVMPAAVSEHDRDRFARAVAGRHGRPIVEIEAEIQSRLSVEKAGLKPRSGATSRSSSASQAKRAKQPAKTAGNSAEPITEAGDD